MDVFRQMDDDKARIVVSTEESCPQHNVGTRRSRVRWTRWQTCSLVIPIAVLVVVIVSLVSVMGRTRGSKGGAIKQKGGSTILLPPSLPPPDPLLSSRPLTFLAMGDWGRAGDYNQADVARAMGDVAARRGGVDFIISTGDNFYPNGLAHADDANFSISFSHTYTSASLQRPWFAVLGNHDYEGDPSVQTSGALTARDQRWQCNRTFEVKRDLCADARQDADDGSIPAEKEGSPSPSPSPSPFPAGQLECKNVTVSIFFIDTTPMSQEYRNQTQMNRFRDGNGVDLDADTTWQLTKLGEKLKGAENDTWRIVVGHHPLYSTRYQLGTPGLTDRLLPILESGGVHLYINGHGHDLEHVKKGYSTVHMVTTGAGSKLKDMLLPVDDGYLFRLRENGFLYVDVDAYRIRSDFYNISGNIVHSFDVVK